MVDGIGDVGSVVIRERKMLSEAGLIIVSGTMDSVTGMMVAGPDITSRGFVYVREREDLIDEARWIVEKSIERASSSKGKKDIVKLKNTVREDLRKFIFKKTKRSPMIIPIFMEV